MPMLPPPQPLLSPPTLEGAPLLSPLDDPLRDLEITGQNLPGGGALLQRLATMAGNDNASTTTSTTSSSEPTSATQSAPTTANAPRQAGTCSSQGGNLVNTIVCILDCMEDQTNLVLNDMEADVNATQETSGAANSYGTTDGELTAAEMFTISDMFNKFSQGGTTAIGGQNEQDETKQSAVRRLS